ncbi:S1 RNA-binding domain-containing protein [Candidatus Woesearchaeota archaeon]|nr:S1 RNA-binding domain-containing protein [Candidatus Woesearchaeota archaeon]
MYYHEEGFPEENELVLCEVTSVQYNSVFCRLDHYGKSGMIHISEVAPGRIRNIRDYVVEGKKVVCKVLRINEERGHIDLSLRRVNENQRRTFNALIKQEQKAEKIIENLASEMKQKPKEVYDAIAKPLFENYEFIHMAFQEHVDGDAKLEEMGIPKEYVKPLAERVIDKIKPKSVTIGGTLKLTTYDPDGITLVKKALTSGEAISKQITIRYLGSGAYKVEVTADEYKEAEDLLKQALDTVTTELKGGDVDFARA